MWETLEGMVREKAQEFIQQIMEEEVTELLGREKSERRSTVDSAEGYRNGYGKARRLAMSSGTITLRRPRGSSPELCVKVRGSSSMLRLGCVGDLLRFEKREIEVAAFAPDRSSPQSNRGDEAERTGSVGEGAGAPDPTLDLGVQALEAVRGA